MAWTPRTPDDRLISGAAGARLPETNQGTKAVLVLLLILLLILGAFFLWENRPRPRPPLGLPTTVPASASRPMRIATWNLRKFSDRARPDVAAIARLIRSSEYDLLAIQEVQQQGQAVQRLRMALGEPWRHVISDQTGNHERFAFLYRADVIQTVTDPAFIDSPESPAFDRVPFTGRFRAGNFDFTLMTVHLWYGDANSNPRRQQEVQALARIYEQFLATSDDKDLILLGDFNEFRTGGYLHYLESLGLQRLNSAPTNLSSTQAYDNILIHPTHTREVAGRTGVLMFDETEFANDDKTAADDISDHRPVFADFHTTLPDDD